jgi:hypothetical protein
LVPLAPVITTISTLAPNIAAFNNIEYFKIQSNLGGQGRTNGRFDQTLAQVNITARPGSQIVYLPQHTATIPLQGWTGTSRSFLEFWLTNHRDEQVPTGEIWSARLEIAYDQVETLDTVSGPGPHSSVKRTPRMTPRLGFQSGLAEETSRTTSAKRRRLGFT